MAKKVTPRFYFPCRCCGLWRRQHIGKERKCPFASGVFEPVAPENLSMAERLRLLDRIKRLQYQKVDRPRKELDELDTAIDGVVGEATKGCTHKDDQGGSLLDRQPVTVELDNKTHVKCELCDEDWYE